MGEYTHLSQEAYEHALFPTLTVQEAVEWVAMTSCFRTLPEKLMKFYPGTKDEFKAKLREGFFENHPSPKEQESLRKNISNWVTPAKRIDSRTISREYALEISFILKLTSERADELLRSVCGEGLHYRNIREFVAAYALDQGLTYIQYLELLEKAHVAQIRKKPGQETIHHYTCASKAAVTRLTNENALMEYIENHKLEFGYFRNTAYAYFMEMLDALQNGGTNVTVEELVEQNLYRRFVKKHGKLSAVEKSIRAGWPEETAISKMKKRELAVSRKVLILLYLASGGETAGEYNIQETSLEAFRIYNDTLEDDSENADFESLKRQIDSMLVECGFAPLDPRLPFDWMVLFCMATGDLFDLDERFGSFLDELFGNEMQA